MAVPLWIHMEALVNRKPPPVEWLRRLMLERAGVPLVPPPVDEYGASVEEWRAVDELVKESIQRLDNPKEGQ